MNLGFLKKITDFIMPLEPIEEEEEEKVEKVEEKKAEVKAAKVENIPERKQESVSPISIPEPVEMGQMRTAESGSVAFGGVKYTAYAREVEPMIKNKPQLTVVKGGGMNVKINKPAKFEEVRNIADDLLGKFAVIVNYELVERAEQQRISDFVNGVCYVTDGRVEQISERIVLYMPEGMDAEAAIAGYAMR